MYDEKTRTITLPHMIPGDTLVGSDGKKTKLTINDACGGATRIADFGLTRNTFAGGNVAVLGLIPKYGFHACICVYDNSVLGFYIHDDSHLTPEGKEVIQKRFEGITVNYGPAIEKPVDPKALERRRIFQEKAAEHGIDPDIITHATANELEGLLRAVESGVASKSIAVEQDVVATRAKNAPEVVVKEHGKAPPPPKRMRPPVKRPTRSPIL
jgi:hypothetical protein